ncbi:hypothetical protein PISMIDRAFT_16489 [Pisolithus microcarpus 441]|uniref:Unplaced genomic scaffold scaffold_205, whole genome shotgun sequence n=1 Tax=Pisolithus microcarpus 441 TaxID=765257 RepID=A0A0C9YNT8_9AGAM|nr:hypothetical protein PISMIDRAFT_16489 [Pisolithus microcarpus 441]
MSTSQAATSTKTTPQPKYIPPDTARDLVPKMWASEMTKLVALMGEIPDEAAEEAEAWGWLNWYYDVLVSSSSSSSVSQTIEREPQDQIEGLQQFSIHMSTQVPDYPTETEEAVGSVFLTLVALRNQFPQQARKTRHKRELPPLSSTPAGGETVRRSQRQKEKATVRTVRNSEVLLTSGGSATLEVDTAGEEENAAQPPVQPEAVGESTQESGGGIEVAASAMQTDPEACERCVKRGIKCKKRCNKAGKLGTKRKNPKTPPASSASTSKRARTTPVPPPLSAPPKVTLKVRPRVVGQTSPSVVATGSSAVPQDSPARATSTPPANPLFLPSSQPNTPVPSDNASFPLFQGNLDPPVTTAAFDLSISGAFMDEPDAIKGPSVFEEIDSTTPRALLIHEEGAPLPSRGKDWARTPEKSPFEELDARIEAIEESIKWGEDTLVQMHGQIARLAADVSKVSSAIQRARQQLRVLRKWRQKKFVEGPV